jgi:hypothetical protein
MGINVEDFKFEVVRRMALRNALQDVQRYLSDGCTQEALDLVESALRAERETDERKDRELKELFERLTNRKGV